MRRVAPILTLLCTCAAALPLSAQTEAPKPAPPRNDYSDGADWLCRPGRQDACAVDLTATVISADGSLTTEPWAADPKAPIDCFYVYPTVSTEPTANSGMVPGIGERGVVATQFARFASQCRVFAPLYRQVTLAALRAAITGAPMHADRALAYNDILDAWNYYLEHDNKGRGVVLIGHSQGSLVLTELLKNEIDGKPVQARIISALLLGTSLPVPKGKDAGGAFQHMPLCHSPKQTGCVITYASFRANVPPPATTLFGRVAGEDMMAGCTNPAALGGGSGELHAYLGARGSRLVGNAEAEPGPWVPPPKAIGTRFVSVPGMLSAECVSDEHGSYLAVTVHSSPSDQRAKDIVGDVVIGGQVLPNWGLHLIDVHLALGNLIDIVHQQAQAYLSGKQRK